MKKVKIGGKTYTLVPSKGYKKKKRDSYKYLTKEEKKFIKARKMKKEKERQERNYYREVARNRRENRQELLGRYIPTKREAKHTQTFAKGLLNMPRFF